MANFLKFDSPKKVDFNVAKFLDANYHISNINIYKKFLPENLENPDIFFQERLVSNLYFIDIETNGIFPFEEVVNLSIKKVSIENHSLKVLPDKSFDFFIEPAEFHPETKSKFYLNNNLKQYFKSIQIKKEDLKNFFTNLTDDSEIVLIGHNVVFDYNILEKNNIIHSSEKRIFLIDTMDFAFLMENILRSKQSKLKFSLEELSKLFSTDTYNINNYHTAENDVDATILLFNNLIKLLKKQIDLKNKLYETAYKYLTDNFVLKAVLKKIFDTDFKISKITDKAFFEIIPDISRIENNILNSTPAEKRNTTNSPEDYFPKNITPRDNQKKYIKVFSNFDKKENKYCFIEAPTGTGKTYAYLSYIFYDINKNRENNNKIIYTISTYTKNLQNQIFESINALNNFLPVEKKINAIKIKGKNNYICFKRLYDFLISPDVFASNKKNITVIFLLLNFSKLPDVDGEIESIIPFIIRKNFNINNDLIHLFSYNRTFSNCSECSFTEHCPIIKKRKILTEPENYDIIITNHFLIMQKSDTVPTQNNDVSAPVPDTKQDKNNHNDEFGKKTFSQIIKSVSNKIVFDEAHRIADAYVSSNETKFSLSDLSFLKNYLSNFINLFENFQLKKSKKNNEKYNEIISKKDNLIKKINGILNIYSDALSQFKHKIKQALATDINNSSLYPEKKFTLKLNTTTYYLLSKYYLSFNQKIKFFTEHGNQPDSITFDKIQENQKFSVTKNISLHLGAYKNKKLTYSIFEEISYFFSDVSEYLKNEKSEEGDEYKEFESSILKPFNIVYTFFKEKQKIFEKISLQNLIDNYFFMEVLYDPEFTFLSPYNRKIIFNNYKKYNLKQQITLIAYTVKQLKEENEDEIISREDISRVKIKVHNYQIRDWEFFITDIDIGKKIKNELQYFKKTLFTSATLDFYDGTALPFFIKEYGLLNEDIYSVDDKPIIKLPEVFDMENQMFIAVPYYLPTPKEYFYDEFKYDSFLETIRILKFFENFTFNEDKKFKVLNLFTSSVMLLYHKYFSRKITDENKNFLLNNFELFFQRELPKEELISKFIKTNEKIAVLFGLQSFGEGFDIVNQYRKEIKDKNATNPIKLLIINKIPFLNLSSLYHNAKIFKLKSDERVEKIMRQFDRTIKIKHHNAAMFSYILPLTAINLKQWIGRLIRSKKDKGIVFLNDTRCIDKNYSILLRRYVGDNIKFLLYGENFYASKNSNMEKYLFENYEPPHYFQELMPYLEKLFGAHKYNTEIYDYEPDEISKIRYKYWHQETRLQHGNTDVPRFFTIYFHKVLTLLLNKNTNKKNIIKLEDFIKNDIINFIENKTFRDEVITHLKSNLKELFERRNFSDDIKEILTLDKTNFTKTFEKDLKKFKKELGEDNWKKYVLNKILDIGNNWNNSIYFTDNQNRIGYMSQRNIMARVFGIDLQHTEEFKKGEDIRTDSVFILKTGFGKSLCFQIPALLDKYEDGITLVFAPLRALMRNQVEDFRNTISNSHIGYMDYVDSEFSAKDEVIKRLKANDFRSRIIYMNPIRLSDPKFFDLLLSIKIRRVVIDEMHTLIEWADDFTPDFNLVPIFIEQYYLKNKITLPVFSFSASIHRKQKEDIERKFKKAKINFTFYRGTYNREKLKITSIDFSADSLFETINKKINWLKEKILNTFYDKIETDSGDIFYTKKHRPKIKKMVIFCQNKGWIKDYIFAPQNKNNFKAHHFGVISLYEILENKDFTVASLKEIKTDKNKYKEQLTFFDNNIIILNKKKYYIKNTEKKYLREIITYFYGTTNNSSETEEIQTNFYKFKNNKDIKVIMTTEAFGMGVDLKDIDLIIHFDFPKSVEQYYQQIGRCRGNGEAIFLYSSIDYEHRTETFNSAGSDSTFIQNLLPLAKNDKRLFSKYLTRLFSKIKINFATTNIYFLQYNMLKNFLASYYLRTFSEFEKYRKKNLPTFYATHFVNPYFSFISHFYNYNSVVNLFNFNNIFQYTYKNSVENLANDLYPFLPFYLKYKMREVTDTLPEYKKNKFISNIFIPLLKWTINWIKENIIRIETNNSDYAFYSYSITIFDLFHDMLNVEEKTFKFENSLDAFPGLKKLLFGFLYTFIIPAFTINNMFSISFAAYNTNFIISLEQNTDINNFVKEVTPHFSIEDLKDILMPNSTVCRRYKLISYFNEAEANLIKHPAENCCDVCDKQLLLRKN